MMAGFTRPRKGVIVNLSIQASQEGVTIAGKLSDELVKGTQMSILKQASLRGSEQP
jgi:hypothetical protein